jgi:tRNA dimethylallyltransferase
MIVILGPTASGKTSLACGVAARFNGEILSADSRQVYQGLDLGTGKDLHEYQNFNPPVISHLIDLVKPGFEYNVFHFQQDFLNAYNWVVSKGKLPVLTGGTGLYLESILKGYRLKEVPENQQFRKELDQLSDRELANLLIQKKKLHNTTDLLDRNRTIRALEIEQFLQDNPENLPNWPHINQVVFGIQWDRAELKRRITERLLQRLEQGLLEEVQGLLREGVSAEQLKFYGLEYRFLTMHLLGELNFNDMFQKLNSGIHAFAKRQMTWFRKMERNGTTIHWLEGPWDLKRKIEEVELILAKTNRGSNQFP